MAMKACFITGAASGIGLATGKRFAAEGYFIGLSDVDEDALAKAAAEFDPGQVVAIRLDVRNEAAWGLALARFGKASGGRLDVMINNAGLARYGWFETQTSADWDLQIDVNLRGVIYGSYAALPLLKATKDSVLVNIASSSGLSGPPLRFYHIHHLARPIHAPLHLAEQVFINSLVDIAKYLFPQ